MTTSDPTHTHTHTHTPPCRLAPVPDPPPAAKTLEGIPPIHAQFFYASPIPIDDPLSAAPIISSTDARPAKLPIRPFAPADNAALERAWLAFASDCHSRTHAHARAWPRSTGLALEKENADKLAVLVASLAGRHRDRHEREALAAVGAVSGAGGMVGVGLGGVGQDTTPEHGGMPMCCADLEADVAAELRREFCAVARRRQQALGRDRVLEAVMTQLARLRMEADGGRPGADVGLLGTSPVVQVVGSVESTRASTPFADGPPLATSLPGGGFMTARPPVLDDGISGKPFVRVEPTTRSNRSSGVATPDERAVKTMLRERVRGDSRASARGRPAVATATDRLEDSVELPVGISRLHMVSLPVLQMKPIYWSPVGDIATVLRATWFYRDTMVPVEPIVANQLETGYRELRPWTETWGDELRSALDVGPLGEEKVSHRLWPEPDKRHKSKDDFPPELSISTDPFCAARCFRGEAAAEGTLEPVHADQDTTLPPPESRMYSSYHVIYKDASTAFLLKPSQKPSAYYSRKPVSKIMKGVTVGLPVVRGFDRAAWERVHDKQAASRNSTSKTAGVPTADLHQTAGQDGCPGCQLDQDRGQVTDLVLVAHGIGQKLSERVEAYHFTHYVTAFRRSINIELQSPTVKSVLRPGQNGIMVLPVNWRHLLTFDDGDSSEADKSAYSPEGFTLKDIEPPTIPAVRSMISDVMFDIPFYMSHLKPKMIAALVGEANRVYRLWCKNNPGFSEKGRVHLIAHSLGSAMAIEVLSKQPTRVPRPLDVSTAGPPDTRFFEFDTTNLFLLGSPAGFFLLLERGGLVPRRGRLKPGADAADTVAKDVVGDVGLFGCIAVDNIYNILAKEDPIAYLLNGTIDPVYAAGLRLAYVPSISTSFFKSVGDAVRGLAGAAPAPDTSLTAGDGARAGKPPPAFARMPSQLELEVHDFTREEVAERKAFLLNDNGQIDYFLRSGGGPLEIQYLNMLSAHTSYWTNQDLIRLLCLEIGRVPGRAHALGSMRAVKTRGGFVGEH